MAAAYILELLVESLPSIDHIRPDDMGYQSCRMGVWLQQLLQPLRDSEHCCG